MTVSACAVKNGATDSHASRLSLNPCRARRMARGLLAEDQTRAGSFAPSESAKNVCGGTSCPSCAKRAGGRGTGGIAVLHALSRPKAPGARNGTAPLRQRRSAGQTACFHKKCCILLTRMGRENAWKSSCQPAIIPHSSAPVRTGAKSLHTAFCGKRPQSKPTGMCLHAPSSHQPGSTPPSGLC